MQGRTAILDQHTARAVLRCVRLHRHAAEIDRRAAATSRLAGLDRYRDRLLRHAALTVIDRRRHLVRTHAQATGHHLRAAAQRPIQVRRPSNRPAQIARLRIIRRRTERHRVTLHERRTVRRARDRQRRRLVRRRRDCQQQRSLVRRTARIGDSDIQRKCARLCRRAGQAPPRGQRHSAGQHAIGEFPRIRRHAACDLQLDVVGLTYLPVRNCERRDNWTVDTIDPHGIDGQRIPQVVCKLDVGLARQRESERTDLGPAVPMLRLIDSTGSDTSTCIHPVTDQARHTAGPPCEEAEIPRRRQFESEAITVCACGSLRLQVASAVALGVVDDIERTTRGGTRVIRIENTRVGQRAGRNLVQRGIKLNPRVLPTCRTIRNNHGIARQCGDQAVDIVGTFDTPCLGGGSEDSDRPGHLRCRHRRTTQVGISRWSDGRRPDR